MSKKTQNRYTAEEKSKILKRHLVENEPLSGLCEEFNISPSTFYKWQKKLFENAPSALETQKPGRSSLKKLEQHKEELQAKISHKDEVLAEAKEALLLVRKLSGENSIKRG